MRLSHVLITSLALGLASVPALAQGDAPPPRSDGGGPPGGGGAGGGRGGGARAGMPQLSPEQLKAAYEAQATCASKAAGLDADQTGKVVTAYQDARASQTKAMEEMRAKLREAAAAAGAAGGEGGGGGARGQNAAEMQKATAEINKTEGEKLQAALNGFLKPEQTEKLMPTLGLFDRQWDQVTVAVVELKLDAGKQDQAMAITQEYATAVGKAREIEDMQARRDATSDARRKMNDEMKKILSEEEFGKFQRASGGGQGRGGAQGRGGGGGQGGGGQGGGGGGNGG